MKGGLKSQMMVDRGELAQTFENSRNSGHLRVNTTYKYDHLSTNVGLPSINRHVSPTFTEATAKASARKRFTMMPLNGLEKLSMVANLIKRK